MTSNLPNDQKTDWLLNETVMPVHTNGWGTAINKLKKAIPVYATCGNYYTASYNDNIFQLTPLVLSDETTNETVSEYVEGMSVIFQCPADNLADCSINVNSLGVKSIKSVYNTNIEAGVLKQGAFIKLTFDKLNNYFKFEQDLSKADINLSNINAAGKTVIDDRINTKIENILNSIYPVNSIYITVSDNETCPIAFLIPGSTWELVSAGRVLQGADSNHAVGTTIPAGLPNHQHTLGAEVWRGADGSTQRVAWDGGDRKIGWATGTTSWASASNSIYGASNTVQPPAYVVNIWRRTA